MNNAVYIPVQHEDVYWTHDIPLFVGSFSYYRYERRMVQGRIHLAGERYFDVNQEIIPINQTHTGKRVYVNMHPYILEPELSMTVGLYPKPKHYADQDEAIGEVLKTNVKGMKQHQIGNSQAWYYPAEKTIVLWECFLEASFRTHPLTEDPYMRSLWSSFEKWLIKQFPEATTIATPFDDPIASTIEEYQTFLRALDYQPSPTAEAAFEKAVS